jgi:hypothetical protein
MPDDMPRPTVSPDHGTHDPLLVAAYAAGDAAGAQLDAAVDLVAACAACAALHHDLRAIARALPATAAAAPSPRPRDFRLTAEQAASLRPAGWRRLLAPLAGPGFAFAKPLGTGLATLGLTGILVAGASGIPLGGAAAQPADQASGGAAAAQEAPATEQGSTEGDLFYEVNAAATEAPAAGGGPGAVPQPTAASKDQPSDQPLTAVGAPLATEPSGAEPGRLAAPAAQPDPSPGPSPVVVVGVIALAAGTLLLALRLVALRAA